MTETYFYLIHEVPLHLSFFFIRITKNFLSLFLRLLSATLTLAEIKKNFTCHFMLYSFGGRDHNSLGRMVRCDCIEQVWSGNR